MFWDKAAKFYDLFEKVYNNKVYKNLGKEVAKAIEPADSVLECACGTGKISSAVAAKCKKLIATDYSLNMLKRARKKCRKYPNAEFAFADITHLEYADCSFDKVIAGNVIHLLDDPIGALRELERVCRAGGKIIVPTYIMEKKGKWSALVGAMDKAGADFKQHFTLQSYREFFQSAGYTGVEYSVVEGRMPCVIAVIAKN